MASGGKFLDVISRQRSRAGRCSKMLRTRRCRNHRVGRTDRCRLHPRRCGEVLVFDYASAPSGEMLTNANNSLPRRRAFRSPKC